ncbi:MAG: alpha/beta fold hydrolase [Rhizobiales bacterium]|nr:alpha/beta fold hydrolase [Rhizobacter sp.]
MPKLPKTLRSRWLALTFPALLSLGTLAGCQSLDTQQRKWIFQASVLQQSLDEGAGIDGLDDVWIKLDEVPGKPRLHALWGDGPKPNAPVMLYLHGARRHVDSSAFRIRHMRELGFAVLAIDYRGFGRSSAALPSETLAHEDALAAWQWLAERHPNAKRYLFGHSLGGAIAVRLAGDVDDAAGLMVEGSFTSIADVVQSTRWGWLPLSPLITQRFDAASHIERVKAPLLVVHGSEDRLIQPTLGRALFERARSPKRFVLVDGGTHHNTNAVGQEAYRSAIAELFGWRATH